jgi:hypothetical protein
MSAEKNVLSRERLEPPNRELELLNITVTLNGETLVLPTDVRVVNMCGIIRQGSRL